MGRILFPLSRVVNYAVIALAILIAAFLTKGFYDPSSEARANNALNAGRYLPANITTALDHDKTLLLAIRRGCHFCEDSMPFYRTLAQMEHSHRLTAHILAVLPDDPVSVQFLLKSEHLVIDARPNVPLNSIFVDGTPTAILADRNGKILHAWEGELSPAKQAELIAMAEQP